MSEVKSSEAPTSSLLDTCSGIVSFLERISNFPTDPPSLYLDLEGEALSRNGSISLLAIYIPVENHAYLVDIHNLKGEAFASCGPDGNTLKHVLESPNIPKVFFDVRNDSDALYAHYGIKLAGIQDIQVMENAARRGGLAGKKFLNGLARCIERDCPMTLGKKQRWLARKERGHRLFDPTKGGSYEVFDARPLTKAIVDYCVQDVCFMPQLRNLYWEKLDIVWQLKVEEATKARVLLSQSAGYQPHGRHKALGPWPVLLVPKEQPKRRQHREFPSFGDHFLDALTKHP
ncbi:MAG: hypothetical protein M1825_001510 [Sarcosagium campestre]|nr:MAG: hypothetical protein M1825_001510 [Sarcosagium campestre]